MAREEKPLTPDDESVLRRFREADIEYHRASRGDYPLNPATDQSVEDVRSALAKGLKLSLELDWIQDAAFFAEVYTAERVELESRPVLSFRFSCFGWLVCLIFAPSLDSTVRARLEEHARAALEQHEFRPVTLEQAHLPYEGASVHTSDWFNRFFEYH